LALGINAVFTERSMTNRRPIQFVMGIMGCAVCAVGISYNLIQKLTG
jgi:hypothetical protein